MCLSPLFQSPENLTLDLKRKSYDCLNKKIVWSFSFGDNDKYVTFSNKMFTNKSIDPFLNSVIFEIT